MEKNMVFFSLGIIVVFGFIGGYLFEKIKLSKLLFHLILGFLLGPSLLNFIKQVLLNISSYLRQIALIIIITRSGLSLDFIVLKKIGINAMMMRFLPAIFEIIGCCIFA